MTQKELNCAAARRIAEAPFWRADLFTKYYAPDFTMEVPTAPPGMPNYFSTWEAERCFEWLNRTVRAWDVKLEKFYSSPDPDLFWAIGSCDADVCWGDHDGRFSSLCFLKLVVHEGKVKHLSWRMDANAMLEAAGRKRPPFDIAMDDPRVQAFKPWRSIFYPYKVTESPAEGDSPEAVWQRTQDNFGQNVCGAERERFRALETKADGFEGWAWFVPQEQTELTEKLRAEQGGDPINAWVKTSSPWMYRDPRGKVYATDDPHVYFGEMNSYGPGCWLCHGQGQNGHYHQTYLMIMRVDDAGRLAEWKEVLSPINIYQSAAIEIPSFPYYY